MIHVFKLQFFTSSYVEQGASVRDVIRSTPVMARFTLSSVGFYVIIENAIHDVIICGPTSLILTELKIYHTREVIEINIE